jgi:hypothetical protein
MPSTPSPTTAAKVTRSGFIRPARRRADVPKSAALLTGACMANRPAGPPTGRGCSRAVVVVMTLPPA